MWCVKHWRETPDFLTAGSSNTNALPLAGPSTVNSLASILDTQSEQGEVVWRATKEAGLDERVKKWRCLTTLEGEQTCSASIETSVKLSYSQDVFTFRLSMTSSHPFLTLRFIILLPQSYYPLRHPVSPQDKQGCKHLVSRGRHCVVCFITTSAGSLSHAVAVWLAHDCRVSPSHEDEWERKALSQPE